MSGKVAILAILVLSLAPGFAQDQQMSGRTCRLVFPEKPSNSPRFVYLFDGKKNTQVYLSAVNFSDVVKLAPGDVSLVMAPEPINDPEAIPPEYPRLAVAKEIRNIYVFLSPDPRNQKLPLSMSLVSLDAGEFKIGCTLWYNFTNHRIAAKLGDTKISVDARQSVISGGPLRENGYYTAEFVFQPNSTGDFRKITEQQWWFDANCRYVGFIVDRGTRLPRIYFFRDFRDSEETVTPKDPG